MRRYGWNFVLVLPRVWKWKPIVTLHGRPRPRLGIYAYIDQEDDQPTLSIAVLVELRVSLVRTWTRRQRREQESRSAEILASEAADWLEEHSP